MKRIAITLSLLFVVALLEATCLPAQAGIVEDFNALYNQASIADNSKQYERALELGNQAAKLSEREAGVSSDKIAWNFILLASIHQHLNQWMQAVDSCERAISVAQSQTPQNPVVLVYGLTRLAELNEIGMRPEIAESAALQAVNLEAKYFHPDAPGFIGPLGELGGAYLAQGKMDLASATLEQGLRIANANKEVTGMPLQNLLIHVAKLYRMTGRESEAMDFENRAAEVPTATYAVTSVRPPVPTTPAAPLPKTCRMEYPREAIFYLLEDADVGIVAFIDATGQLTEVRVTKSSGWPILDKATVKGYNFCRFTPAMLDGKPIASTLNQYFHWSTNAGPPESPPLIQGSCLPSEQFRIAPADTTQPTIELRFLLNTQGKPYKTMVKNTKHDTTLNTAAIEFVESCRYQPTLFKGQPVVDTASIRLLWK